MISEEIKKLLKKRWYFQGFNGTPGVLSYPTEPHLKEIHEILGFGYNNIIQLFEGDKCYFLYSWEDLEHNLQLILQKVKKDPNYLQWVLKKDKELQKNFEKVLKRLYKIDINLLTFEEALKEEKIFARAYSLSIGVSLMIESFTYPTEDLIRNTIKDELEAQNKKEKVKEGIKLLSAAVQPSFVGHHQIELLKIAEKKKVGKDITKDIEKLQKKKFWMNDGYAGSEILPTSYFKKEVDNILKKIPNPKEERQKRNEHFKTIVKRKQEFIRKNNLSKELKMLIEINNVMSILHDTRKESITEANHFIDLFLERVGKELNIPLELMRYAAAYEIYNEKKREKITKELLQERKGQCVFTYQRNKECQSWTGKEAKEIIAEINKEHDQKEHDILHGHCASEGVVIGIIRVCRGLDTIKHFKENEILVACMTQPEFVPAMKKAAAIVTDEGGLTCHAAIISRELHKPCIISTKKATRVLKNGMKVEVNATEGYVRIIKN
jgi:phosphohistidine swiveling domain-containing protein